VEGQSTGNTWQHKAHRPRIHILVPQIKCTGYKLFVRKRSRTPCQKLERVN